MFLVVLAVQDPGLFSACSHFALSAGLVHKRPTICNTRGGVSARFYTHASGSVVNLLFPQTNVSRCHENAEAECIAVHSGRNHEAHLQWKMVSKNHPHADPLVRRARSSRPRPPPTKRGNAYGTNVCTVGRNRTWATWPSSLLHVCHAAPCVLGRVLLVKF